MSGSKSPDAAAHHGSPPGDGALGGDATKSPGTDKPLPATVEAQDTDLPNAPVEDISAGPPIPNGDNDGAESEAETIMTSPVKKREAEKQQQQQPAVKQEERPPRSRIGGLPVPGDDDEDMSSPMMSTENATPAERDEDAEMVDEDDGSDKDAEGDESDDLSSPNSEEDAEGEEDEEALSRPQSERPESQRNGADSPNPRKRKHRASSASLPNSKRQSMDPPKRRLRGMNSDVDATGVERSASPNMRSHRRAFSTQSALNGTHQDSMERKRQNNTQFPVKEPKPAVAKSGWEESDASSETASRGHVEEACKRLSSRGIGRSTSTPGRPGGREHKRHVNRYGFTQLAEACEKGKLDLVKEWREKDPDQLEIAEFARNKPLQIAALNGNALVVSYLISQGCEIDCANVDKDTPLIDAAENGHVEVVKLLLEAGVDPLRQNLKGQQALDVVTDETDDAPAIRASLNKAIDAWNSSSARAKREEEEEARHNAGPSMDLHFMARSYENLLRLVANNDRNGVREFMAARVPVDNAVIAAAARTGDVYLVNMLLAEMSEKKANQRTEKPLLAVLGSSHWEMVQALTELETFNPLWADRQGRTWAEMAEERKGPHWRLERDLLEKLFNERGMAHIRRSSSPVSRRDGGGKRFLRRPNTEEEDLDDEVEEVKKRTIGRRLMSRKDMRAAGGRDASSDSGSEGEDADAEGEMDEDDDLPGEYMDKTMQPPGSPSTKRQPPTKPRSKSISSQASEVSPRSRPRSSSMREQRPPLDPTALDKPFVPVIERPAEASVDPNLNSEARQKEEGARFVLAEAQRLAAKQQEAADAEAEAKRAEEAETQRLEDERQRQEEQKLEQERQRQAEEAARRAAEEAAIKAREEEAQAAKLAQEREAYKRDVLASLPPGIRQVLDPQSDFTYEGLEEKAWLVEHFTPLHVVRVSDRDSLGNECKTHWVLNLQIAPLVGKAEGLELVCARSMIRDTTARFRTSDVDCVNGEASERQIVMEILDTLPTTARPGAVGEDRDWNTCLAQAAERMDSLRRLKYWALHRNEVAEPHETSGDRARMADLRLVQLDDALAGLHPLLKDIELEVEYLESGEASAATNLEEGGLKAEMKPSFFEHLRRSFEAKARGCGGDVEGVVRWSEVRVVHEK